jgi:hypothetical protein
LFSSNEIKEKIKQTYLKKYGVDNFRKTEEYLSKCRKTKIEKYGNENYSNPEKVKNTCLSRYGVSNPNKLKSVRNKIKNTHLEKYGVDNFTKTQEYREKTLATNFRKYGVRNVNQSEDFQQQLQKKSYKFKSYILPSGKEIKVQGYEPFALNFLLKHHDESDIITDRKFTPKFWYITNDGKNRIYYPDMYIKSSNTVIETKSLWTNTLHQVVDELKKQSVLNGGYNFRKLIFGKKGEIIQDQIFENSQKIGKS